MTNYIEATKAVRKRYLSPRGPGGAAFVDLFAGPGKKRIADTGEIVSGSPLIALEHAEAPFTTVVACDIERENVDALENRSNSFGGRCVVVRGNCNERIDAVLQKIPLYGLNLALVDPFGLKSLKFSTISKLGAFSRMDLIIHFPTGDIKRNVREREESAEWLDEALGTRDWRKRQNVWTDVNVLVDVLVEQLKALGYSGKRLASPAIKNNEGVPMYHLVFASKHDKGDKIWASVTRTDRSGQGSLGFDF